jgi:hypothetical protein
MRQKLPYKIARTTVSATASTVRVGDDEDPIAAVRDDAWQSLGTYLELTIGDVTMHAAAWEDPEHWAEDWAQKLDVDLDEAPDAVAALIAGALEDA